MNKKPWIDKNHLPMWMVFLLVRPLKASLSAGAGMFAVAKIVESYEGTTIPHYLMLCLLTFGSTFVVNFFVNAAELLGRLDWVSVQTADNDASGQDSKPTDPTIHMP